MADTPDDDAGNDTTPPAKVLGREERIVRKRFYTAVTVMPGADGYLVGLDGRGVRTPGKVPLVVRAERLAAAIAAEWEAQVAEIQPATMPLTTLACTAIDAVSQTMPEVAADIGRYAMSDLVCYRAEAPAELVALQVAGWDPVLDWAAGELGVSIVRTTGLMPVEQSPQVAAGMVTALAALDLLRLAAMHVLTTLFGSALLALALLRGRLTLEDAWKLAHIDEDWQIARWGTDAEAEARQVGRKRNAVAAATVLEMLKAGQA